VKIPQPTLLLLSAAIGAIMLAPCAVMAKEKLTGEQQLAKLLVGRVAEKPVSCISLLSTQDSTVIDKTAIVYDSGRVIYVNRPTNADQLSSDDILVTRTSTDQLCRIDTVNLRGRTSGAFSGFVGLNDFVPYRRVAKAN
jgi:hypothetical protein